MIAVLEGVLVVATILCALANAIEVSAKVIKADFVMRNCAEVGLSARWIPYLAVVEGAGVIGLVLGLLGVHPVGLARPSASSCSSSARSWLTPARGCSTTSRFPRSSSSSPSPPWGISHRRSPDQSPIGLGGAGAEGPCGCA